MDKAIIVAKIRRQQAEIAEMIAQLREDRRLEKVQKILEKRYRETDHLLEALGEKSYIPKGVVELDAVDELKKTDKKIEKIRVGLKKIEKLDKEKKKIEKRLK